MNARNLYESGKHMCETHNILKSVYCHYHNILVSPNVVYKYSWLKDVMYKLYLCETHMCECDRILVDMSDKCIDGILKRGNVVTLLTVYVQSKVLPLIILYALILYSLFYFKNAVSLWQIKNLKQTT